MTFILTIELGTNDMQSGYDVAQALTRLAKRIKDTDERLSEIDGGKIMDTNGNSVGTWEVR